jgi:hypothetical protein
METFVAGHATLDTLWGIGGGLCISRTRDTEHWSYFKWKHVVDLVRKRTLGSHNKGWRRRKTVVMPLFGIQWVDKGFCFVKENNKRGLRKREGRVCVCGQGGTWDEWCETRAKGDVVAKEVVCAQKHKQIRFRYCICGVLTFLMVLHCR